jgi:16S rRNA (uracil1498-N3)-methyltransferase
LSRHTPHLVVSAPWEGQKLGLSVVQWRHITKVLRMKSGQAVTYTDGLGTIGRGILGPQLIDRGDEETVPRPRELTVAVAPPANKDRQRFLVEKLAELGIARLLWLETEHGQERVANSAKVFTWVVSAVEQSRGAHLMETSPEFVRLEDLTGRLVVCHPGGDTATPSEADVVAIGPEGGFADDEIPKGAQLWDLGPTVLRVETAAIVASISIRGN